MTWAGRTKRSDASIMQDFYYHYYQNYIHALPAAVDNAVLTEAYQTAAVLFEVLKAVNHIGDIEVADKILQVHDTVAEKMQLYMPYNILPLHLVGHDQPIMRYPEIQAIVSAIRNISGLPWPKGIPKKVNEDILDWLQAQFGFQMDNVANQREHLILLLANVHIQQFPKPDQQPKLNGRALKKVMKKLFRNYKNWCKHLDVKSSLWLPTIPQEVQQRKLLYIGLYLLIWGEAANLRFMPECLCYIYHHMAFELYGMLAGSISPMAGVPVSPAYGGDDESFLKKVVTPIYETIAKEAQRSKGGNSKHSQWRNYDDLNEYFWSVDCFRLGWPMRADADFFCQPLEQLQVDKKDDEKPYTGDQWIGKTNFVEIRSFWHIFRSFYRMWSFYILCLQAMIIIASNGSGKLISIFDGDVFKKVSSIFITAVILKLVQAVLDIVLNWKARQNMSIYVKLRYILKAVTAAAWVIVLITTYAYSWKNPPVFAQTIKSWVGNNRSSPSLYILAVLIFFSPNMLSTVLFLFPFIGRFLKRSNNKIAMLLMWCIQPQLYVGGAMHESSISIIKYTMFWVLLIASKLAFSYYIEIRPLVGPTKLIMQVHVTTFQGHEFFPQAKKNIGVVIALWAPVIIVYFMDTQIWYAIFSTLFGGIYGIFRHIGEDRTSAMLRLRFESLPGAFNACLIPVERNEKTKKGLKATFSSKFDEIPSNKGKEAAKFAQLWNQIISCFREEDLITNWEMDLLLVPYWADPDLDLIQWPPFLLASKILAALDMARDSNGRDSELRKRLKEDKYINYAVCECYASFKNIISLLVLREREKLIINEIFFKVDSHIEKGDLMKELNLSALPSLYEQSVELIDYLLANENEHKDQVVIVLQNMLEIVTKDILDEEISSLAESSHGGYYGIHQGMAPRDLYLPLFCDGLRFPVEPETEAWKEKIKRLHLLLTTREPAMDVPSNLEARRRISFFSNSLFMDMPTAPKVKNMLSFSVLTPYNREDVLYSMNDLEVPNEDGLSKLFHLQKSFPDEWRNFLERVQCSNEELIATEEMEEELRLWASYRGQTLARTVRGMMYYRKALELQAFLDVTKGEDLMKGYKAAELDHEKKRIGEMSLLAQFQAIVDLKFTYVVSCQQYGIDKRSGHPRAKDILKLMTKYPSLRVAYIDEVEEPRKGYSKKGVQKVYYSTLVKADPSYSDISPGLNLDQVIYRIKLPGSVILGEGKPENQNHAIIFTRGEVLQTIDMNQVNYMEEAFKMRNLLQEFLKKHDGMRLPTILGLREHIFAESVSSLAWFMSNQENSSETVGQQLLANLLKVRFHYGHPDVFDRLFHLTRGGFSKASKVINLSKDIFAGFNSTLREGNVTHHEYIQVGKGRDFGLEQITMFEAKIANGNGEQTLSRDIYRLGHLFNFFRMLSFYFTTVGFYFSTLLTVLTVYVFLYGRLYLILSGLEEGLSTEPVIQGNKPLQEALASQSFSQIGFLMSLPMMVETSLEKGIHSAFTDYILMQLPLSDFILMHLQLGPIFFTFSLGTKAHYYGRTLLHGCAQYGGVGRGFAVVHAKFSENYRLYSRSHFVKGIELMILLLAYQIFGKCYGGAVSHFMITISIWFMVGTWLFAPFLFNPSGFEWQKIVDDWADWNKWITNQGGIGVSPEKSWESWWEKEQEHLRYSGKCGIIVEIFLALRFFIYQYGLLYHLNLTKEKKCFLVYGVSWLVIVVILLVMKVVSVGRGRLSAQFRLFFRMIVGLSSLAFLSVFLPSIPVPHLTLWDIIVCILALTPTGWGLILIAQASKPLIEQAGCWGSVRALARGYEIIIGLLLFTPVAFFAGLPFVSEFQTRMLFNQAYSRGLQISRILGRHRNNRSTDKK
ncbi:callose synthase 3-like isoform X2 [Quercus lobata]|nr:callose synthase 3-like isoform X2 [Quercus lobata]